MDNYLSDQLIEIHLRDNMLSVGNKTFKDCYKLSTVHLGAGIDYIGTAAFQNCSSLTSVDRFDGNHNNLFSLVGNDAFRNTRIKKLYLSLRSSSINVFWGDRCFADNPCLEEVYFLSSAYVSNNMFQNCTGLKKVTFKNNHTSYVYPYAFNGCSSLPEITLPDKIWYLSKNMFNNCKSLSSVKFMGTDSPMLDLIQANAFNNCVALKELRFPVSLSSTEMLDDGCFSNCPNLIDLYFPGMPDDELKNSDITKTGLCRLNHDATIYCKSNNPINFTYDPTNQNTMTDFTTYTVDKDTTDKFKPGVPYYNAANLLSYASAQRFDNSQWQYVSPPCLIIYSLQGCKPCQRYQAKIFNNARFQEWIKKQNFYFCAIESETQPFYDDHLATAVSYAKAASNYIKWDNTTSDPPKNVFGEYFRQRKTEDGKLNDNLYTPVIMFYHHVEDKSTVYREMCWLHSFHNIDRYIEDWGVDGTITVLQRLCLHYFDDNCDPKKANWTVGVDKKYDANDLPKRSTEVKKNQYYDEETGIVNMQTYSSLGSFFIAVKTALELDMHSNYIGGCGLNNIQVFNEIGIASSDPEEWNDLLDGLVWVFSNNNKYTLSIDLTDYKQVSVMCSTEPVTIYKVNYKRVKPKKSS